MNTHDLVYVVHKHVGETPLQAIEASRAERGIADGIPMAYAGRLDPMAEGKLLVLTGEKCKEIKKFWDLDKEYKISVVLGISSDSHDVLGRLSYSANPLKTIDAAEIKKAVKDFEGEYSWPYPVLSSKPVKGKPLFQWFLEDRLDEIEIPKSEGKIFNIELTNIRTATPKELKKRTLEKIHALAIVTDESKRLGRDFRRHEVIDSWNTWYKTDAQPLQVLDITCTASSGTYMRTLAHELGERLGTGALALEINRTEVGKYAQFGPLKFWRKKY
ncbi:hypothetical protein JXR01_00915 [Candidatus Kaiserbacteria bacterium]|nr:MAG: hypothetical protein JXR01_00915 [Candidatus Kaiserbacteria bacterium]